MNSLRLHMRSITVWKEILRPKPVNYEGRRSIKRWVSQTQIEITKRKRKLNLQLKEPVRSSFTDWNRDAEIYAFNERLSEKFNLNLLDQAFTHKSYVIDMEQQQQSVGVDDLKLAIYDNEAFIMNGAELTSKTIITYLIQSLPNLPEEGINAIHDYLLSEPVLGTAANNLGVTAIILAKEHPITERTKADTFFALVGALEASVDANQAALFVRDFLITSLANKELAEIWLPSNPLNTLNEILLKGNRGPAEPRIIVEAGKNTILSSYEIGLYSDRKYLGVGCGQTIEEAINIAALKVLCHLYGIADSSNPLKFNKSIDMTQEFANN